MSKGKIRMIPIEFRSALEVAGQELAIIFSEDAEFGDIARATILAFLRAIPNAYLVMKSDVAPLTKQRVTFGSEEPWTPSKIVAALEGNPPPTEVESCPA